MEKNKTNMMVVRHRVFTLLMVCLLAPMMLVHAQKKKTSHKKTAAHKAAKSTTPSSPPGIAITGAENVQLRKSFYLLFLLERKGDAHNTVLKNAVFNKVADERKDRLQTAYSSCKDAVCLGEALRWTPAEIDEVGNEFKRLVSEEPAISELVTQLKTVSRYPVYNNDSDTAFIRKAWQDVATGMNHVFVVYLQGLHPRYPMIDSISFNPTDPAFAAKIKAALQPYLQVSSSGNEFYKQSLLAAFKALELNGRDEATRYEPLYGGQNAAPFAKSRRINWHAYHYSIALVPGAGPGKAGKSIDSMGIYRCGLAAEVYKRGETPFIVVSGGHVHPYKTPFCEAIEMKKYLTTQLGIPDSAVIIEPHARHTTTNIRNAERLIYLFNMPPDKPALIVTDPMQSLMIEKMAGRFINEIGYLPYKSLERVSQTENVFLPDIKAWQEDPNDTLDP
jgi:hypothetical protein